DGVHARRVRPPAGSARLGPARLPHHARGGLVERIPRDAVLPPGCPPLGLVLSGHGADPGVSGAHAVRRHRGFSLRGSGFGTREIRAMKDAATPEQFSRSAEQGVRAAWAAGVTCVADTGSTGAPLEALARLGGRGIYYQEVFGPDPAKCGESLAELRQAVGRL